ncbi:MAG: phosphodiesterase [Pseudomonadota bacterium]
MRTGLFMLLVSLSLLSKPALSGDQLTIPGHSVDGQMQVMPKRGISMEAVLNEFGEPDERFGPVGEPPITEWVYGSFRVYFEYEIVLHSIDLNTLIMPQ